MPLPKDSASPQPEEPTPVTRRQMLKQALMAAVILPQGFGDRGGRGGHQRRSVDPAQIPAYRFKTLPVSRFSELQAEYDKALSGSLYSRAKNFRDEVGKLSFRKPADFANAKSVVVVAAYTKTMVVKFTLDGTSFRVPVPPQYYADEMTPARLKGIVQSEILKSSASRVVDISKTVPLKLLAAHCGLGRYGRNNLIFVDGMGSYNLLYAFLTDHDFGADNWTQLAVMDHCNRCDHCDRSCPTSSISGWNFPINVDKCVTLYNEKTGAFPAWMQRGTHSALMGCLRCQESCPEDGGFAELSGVLEDVSEDETRKILKGMADDALLKSLQRKLRNFPAAASRELFPILTRNLSVVPRT